MNKQLKSLDPSLNILPDSVNTVHLMGIGGTAMAALAGMLVQRGYRVSGSDNPIYPPMSDFLDRLGIPVATGYRAENLAHRPDLVVVGNVISKDNPEAQALAFAGLPYLSMPQVLGRLFLTGRQSLVITGTHGKTTTASLLASSLTTAGDDPSFMIGGIVQEFKANYRLGNGHSFVIEGDEYDTAFFDKESKFLHYRPHIAVITSIEFDHADIFGSLDEIKQSFHRFVSLIPPEGLLVAHLDDPHVADVARHARCPVVSYGRDPGRDWRLGEIEYTRGSTRFHLEFQGNPISQLHIRQPGAYNCLNATAVTAVMHHLGFDHQTIASGLASFQGVKRRQEIRGTVNGITVIDDFAHHPTAVRETLQALRRAYPQQRLIAVFEPRSNTSRRSLFQHDYAASFDAPDQSIIKEPPLLKETDRDDRLSAGQLAADVRRRGHEALACHDTEEIIALLRQTARPGDVIAILSNGGFDNIHERLLAAFREDHLGNRGYPAGQGQP